MIADADSRNPEAQSFVYTEVEKETELVTGVFGEGERAASKKPALREGFAASRVVIWRFWSLFGLILQTGLAESC